MASFLIDASVLGTAKHLLCSGSSLSWVASPPIGAYCLTQGVKLYDDWCLNSLAKLANLDVEISPPTRFVKPIELLVSGSGWDGAVPWQKMLPESAHRAFSKRLIEQAMVVIGGPHETYFRNTWVPGNAGLRKLQPAKINSTKWQELVIANVGNVNVVKTFKPDGNGFAQSTVYDRLGTLTGRLTVKSGPQILTLKKEHRDIIVPSTPGGCVAMLDFAALEARVLLYEAGRRCDDVDLYGALAKELGYPRKAVKGAVISELYGSSKFALGKALGIEGKELNQFVSRVKTFFNTHTLLKRIKDQFVATGKITNRYGRPVVIDEPLDHVLINYYAQSTGVDVALMGFANIIEQFAVQAPEIRPLFSIHDAMVFDVPKKHIELVKSIDSVKVPGYVQSFPLRFETIG